MQDFLLLLENIIDFDVNQIRNECNDIELRTLMNRLITSNIVKVDIDCDNIRVSTNSKLLKPESASISLQWIGENVFQNVYIDEDTFAEELEKVKYLFNIPNGLAPSIKQALQRSLVNNNADKNIINTIDNIVDNTFADNLFPKTINLRLIKLLQQKLGTIVSLLNTDKKFLKLSAVIGYYDPATKQDVLINDNKVMGENTIYKHLMDLLYNYNTPHLAAYYYSKNCQINSTNYISNYPITLPNKNGINKKTTIKNYFDNTINNVYPGSSIKFYNFMVTELVDNSTTTMNILRNILVNNNDEIFKSLIVGLFQIIYTFKIFLPINFVHADLHAGNVFIQTCSEPVYSYYVMNNDMGVPTKVVRIVGTTFAKIFDFDLSYFYNSSHSLIEKTKRNHNNHNPVIRNFLHKYDIYYFLKWCEKFAYNIYQFNNPPIQYQQYLQIIQTILYKNKYNDPAILNKFWIKTDILPYMMDQALIKENLEMSMDPNEALEFVCGLDLKQYGIDTIDELNSVVIEPTSQIFIQKNVNLDLVKSQLESNNHWNKLNSYQKSRVCRPLVDKNELASGLQKKLTNFVFP